jgi:hypothetical protein
MTSKRLQAMTFDDALRSIFTVPDPFAPKLAPDVERGVVLYPTDYRFPADMLIPLSALSQRHGETVLYIAYSEAEALQENGFGPVTTLTFPLAPDVYGQVVADPLQNAHVAGGGTWGALFSNDEFAVLAGSSSFLGQFEKNLPATYDQQIASFLSDRKEDHERFGFGVDWIPPMVLAVFGTERGAQLLAATDFPFAIPNEA